MLKRAAVRAAWFAAMVVIVLSAGWHRALAATENPEPWLGVYSQSLSDELREGMSYRGDGALVTRVIENSPADRAGVRRGDVIVGLNTTTVATASDLARAVRATRAGQTVTVRIVRGNERRTLSAKLSERPAERQEFEWNESPEAPEAPEAPKAPRFKSDRDLDIQLEDFGRGFAMLGMGRGRLGVRVESLNEDLGSYFGIRGGKGALVIEVLKDTPAERAGIKAGDVITKAGDRKVEDAAGLVDALQAAEGRIAFTIVRKGASRTIESELSEGRRVMRFRGDGPLGLHDGDVRIRRELRGGDADVRRELDELRQAVRELREKLKELNRN